MWQQTAVGEFMLRCLLSPLGFGKKDVFLVEGIDGVKLRKLGTRRNASQHVGSRVGDSQAYSESG